MAFELPKLPYEYDALEPYFDKETMILHHGKHHQAYIDNLNKALEGHDDLASKSVEKLLEDIESIPSEIRQTVINHGGGHANHSFFWEILTHHSSKKPNGEIAKAIDGTFGSFEKFQEEFNAKAMGVFGSGWAFLIVNKEGKLELKRHSFQNSPLMHGNTPILGLDVWEHAYYLKYQNRRKEYVEAFWNIVNWQKAEENFKNATSH